MKIVTNHHTQSVSLEDGTILGAAGHAGCSKEVPDLSAADQRLVDRCVISVSDAPLRAVPKSEQPKEAK